MLIFNPLARLFFVKEKGTPILDEEWDSLIILDDCRYGFLKEIYEKEYPEEVGMRISIGSCTEEFLLRNFAEGTHRDCVYVTAQPYVNKFLKENFDGIVSVWEWAWDKENSTVQPESVYRDALRTIREHPGKRIIVHFLQPHEPYPNCKAERLLERDSKTLRYRYDLGNGCVVPWPYVGLKKLPDEELRRGYTENLKLVLPHARRLADFLPGTTVITADHGEAFGEKVSKYYPVRVYGHPRWFRIPATVEVPWVVIRPEDKRPANLEEEISEIAEDGSREQTAREALRVRDRVRRLKRGGRL